MTNFTDTQRLDFMLSNHRKVIVEVLPFNRNEIYVESGFMGDVRGPAIRVKGDLGAEELLNIKRRAIDLAIANEDGSDE